MTQSLRYIVRPNDSAFYAVVRHTPERYIADFYSDADGFRFPLEMSHDLSFEDFLAYCKNLARFYAATGKAF